MTSPATGEAALRPVTEAELAEALREVCMSRQVIVHVPDSALDRWRAALARYDALKEKSR